MKPLKIAVLASGRGSNLQAIIEGIQAGKIKGEIVLVLSDKESAFALERAQAFGIPTCHISPKNYSSREEYDAAIADAVEKSGASLVVLAGFMRILTSTFIDRFPGGIINIHPALLPSFPGLHAQRQAVEYGVKVSGCTVHFVDYGMDNGPIIAQRAVPVLDSDTEDDLASRILVQEHLLYSEVIARIAEGKVKLKGKKVFCEGGSI